MEPINGHFDDPALRDAIHRVWGSETAPQGLRERLHESLNHEVILQLKPMTGWQRWQSRLYGMAAAAVLLIGVGLLAVEGIGVLEARPRPLAVVAVPDNFASSISTAHDTWIAQEKGYLFKGDTALNVIRYRLSHEVGIPVPAEALDGWTLKKAGYSRVGGAMVGHLLYTRGEQNLSVFAIPASSMSYAVNGTSFMDFTRNRPVCGELSGRGLYCVIASGPGVTMRDVVDARKTIMSGLASAK